MNTTIRLVRLYERVREIPGGPTVRKFTQNGFFHGWFQFADCGEAGPVGVVELENGKAEMVEPHLLEFHDRPEGA